MSKKADEAMQRDASDVAKKLLRQRTRNGGCTLRELVHEPPNWPSP